MPLAIITGANRGLGLELSRQYLEDSWAVVALCRNSSPELKSLLDTQNLRIIETDLTDDASLASAVHQVKEKEVDLLINNAGTMGFGSFAATGLDYQAFGTFDRAEWQRVFDINVCTPMALSELLARKLEAAGNARIVTFSSIAGSNTLNTAGNLYAYRCSKSAVNSVMKSMGINLKPRKIIAAAIHPGWVRTDMGGSNADLNVDESVSAIRKTIAGLTLKDSGKLVDYTGVEMPY